MKLFKDKGLIKGYCSTINQNFEKISYSVVSESQKNTHNSRIAENLQFEFEADYELTFEYPAHITNAIISIDQNSINDTYLNNLSKTLASLFTKDLVILAITPLEFHEVERLMVSLTSFDLDSVIFCFTYHDDFHSDEFAELFEHRSFKLKVIVFNSPFDKNYADKYFFFTRAFSIAHKKNPAEFESNLTLFSESQFHHTYFNQKIYVDANGNIKNAPECDEIFGNIESYESILDLINTEEFQKYWNVRKDICDVCKDCEFRHMLY